MFGDEGVCWYADCLEHRLLPEASPSLYSCECINANQDDDSLYRARDYAESESLRVVFVPGLNVEGKES